MTIYIPTWLLILPLVYVGIGVLCFYPICRVAAGRLHPTITTREFITIGLYPRSWKRRAWMIPAQFLYMVVMWPGLIKELAR